MGQNRVQLAHKLAHIAISARTRRTPGFTNSSADALDMSKRTCRLYLPLYLALGPNYMR